MSEHNYTVCLIIIGNEILSGRTQDKNLAWLAAQLNGQGIRLMEVRVIPDIEETIVATVNECRANFTYVFTTGGIGPTHDDITAGCIAKAFGVKLLRHVEAEAILTRHYGPENLNEARLKMADIPDGAALIFNPVSAAPGFIIGNVHVMAGVPSIMQAMFDGIKHTLAGGASMRSHTLSVLLPEGALAAIMGTVQAACPSVEIGSYPFIRQGKLGTSIVMRSTEQSQIAAVREKLLAELTKLSAEILEDS